MFPNKDLKTLECKIGLFLGGIWSSFEKIKEKYIIWNVDSRAHHCPCHSVPFNRVFTRRYQVQNLSFALCLLPPPSLKHVHSSLSAALSHLFQVQIISLQVCLSDSNVFSISVIFTFRKMPYKIIPWSFAAQQLFDWS